MKDKLILSGFISMLFYSVAYPVVHTVVIQNLDSRVLSASSFISCILVIIVNKVWLTKSEKLYKKFGIMLFIEGFLYFVILIMILLKTITPQTYYILDTLLFSSITRNIICGGNRLKAIRYKDNDREEFDNKSVMFYNVASIIGYGISSIIKVPTNIAFVIMYVGIISDNFIYYIVYKQTNKDYN